MNIRKLLIVVMIAVPAMCFAKDMSKVYEKMIRTYDIDASCLKVKDAGDFWDGVWRNNVRLMNFVKAAEKRTPLFKKVSRMLSQAKAINDLHTSTFKIVATNKDSLLIPLYNTLGAVKVHPNITLQLIRKNEMNAFTCPDGSIYLCTGLLTDSVGFAEILGVCAHEMAHFVLQHTAVEAYKVAKREFRNNAVAGVSAGISTAAAGYAAANGVKQDWDQIKENNENLFLSALIDTEKFRYKYSREQEIEADIVAFRFLDFMGYGGEKYIHMLEEIDRNCPDLMVSDTDDHPTTAFRIGLLRYLMEQTNTSIK